MQLLLILRYHLFIQRWNTWKLVFVLPHTFFLYFSLLDESFPNWIYKQLNKKCGTHFKPKSLLIIELVYYHVYICMCVIHVRKSVRHVESLYSIKITFELSEHAMRSSSTSIYTENWLNYKTCSWFHAYMPKTNNCPGFFFLLISKVKTKARL